jgi:hypothetical protein
VITRNIKKGFSKYFTENGIKRILRAKIKKKNTVPIIIGLALSMFRKISNKCRVSAMLRKSVK